MKEWKGFDESKNGRDSISILEKSDREGQVYRDVAQLIFHDQEGYERAREYARLIAAAPELLEACELAKGLIKMAQETFEEGELDIHVLEYIEAAIAKAKGNDV